MRWRFLDRVTALVPGKSAEAIATMNFPGSLYEDHFPTFPVTPGVLLLECCAQLAGKLLQSTVWEARKVWVFPVLTIVYEVKFRSFVAPQTELKVETTLEEQRSEAGLFTARLFDGGKRCLTARFVLAFDPHGKPYYGDPKVLEAFGREDFARVSSPWLPGPPAPPASNAPNEPFLAHALMGDRVPRR